MAITLAESKVGMSDHVDQAVIDEFRRGSFLLENLTFDNCVSPGTGGSNLIYGYTQLLSPSSAQFRAINSEYDANEAKRVKKTAELKVFGGSFEIDRVIQQTSGAVDEMSFQLQQKVKAASNLFHYTVINGNSVKNPAEFDGLDVMLTGSSTEYKDGIGLDLSDSVKVDDNYKLFMDLLDEFLSGLDGKPTMLAGNSRIINRIRACARRTAYFTQSEDAFGRSVDKYNDIPLIDLSEYYDSTSGKTKPVVPIYDTEDMNGLTDLYAITLGLDAFHGASVTGNNVISTMLPDFSKPGAVKKGEVEMVAAVALKNSKKAGVFRGIKVKPTSAQTSGAAVTAEEGTE